MKMKTTPLKQKIDINNISSVGSALDRSASKTNNISNKMSNDTTVGSALDRSTSI